MAVEQPPSPSDWANDLRVAEILIAYTDDPAIPGDLAVRILAAIDADDLFRVIGRLLGILEGIARPRAEAARMTPKRYLSECAHAFAAQQLEDAVQRL